MRARSTHSSHIATGLQGALASLIPVVVLLGLVGQAGNGHGPVSLSGLYLKVSVGLTAALLSGCCLTLRRHPLMAKILGALAALVTCLLAVPVLSQRPAATLFFSVVLLFFASLFREVRFVADSNDTSRKNYSGWAGAVRARWALLTALSGICGASFLPVPDGIGALCCIATVGISLLFFLAWTRAARSVRLFALALLLLIAELVALFFAPLYIVGVSVALLVIALGLLAAFASQDPRAHKTSWSFAQLVSLVGYHPARLLLATFFLLCLFGALLLCIPAATVSVGPTTLPGSPEMGHGSISFLDALFTSVSAVCVTGLAVLDTAHDFSGFGQFCILVLIQLGGLGIMTIGTVALHLLGRRLSLRHEKVLTSMTDTSHQELLQSLGLILRFTFWVEAGGAVLLALCFRLSGDAWLTALWRGFFTSISAFCNAGFALQSDSLIPYQFSPLVLHIVGLLIIFGGMAPATSLVIPRWIRGQRVPVAASIALVSSVALLLLGTVFFLAFEWNGALAGLSLFDRLNNAWFQSVTLRTAGFNSVELGGVVGPTLLVMLVLMFIGGSPGGTAGGIKTSTVAILGMMFWANITSRNEIVIARRRIHNETMFRAVTVVGAGVIIWFLVVIMLEATQDIGSRQLIFEATSALGTVGLSIGATGQLDEIGKIIVILAMFIGRVGPISLFMLLHDDQPQPDTRYPVQRISIT